MAAAVDLAFRDLAVVLLAAGVATLVFWKLKQPVVLGYLVAGFLLGPFLASRATLEFLGGLGIVFLLFALGLEFNLRKLRKVGAVALVAGTLEISVMLWLGWSLGRLFGWSNLESIFLGAVVSISSTTLIVKLLEERGGKEEGWAQVAFGVLLIEDVLAVVILTGLSSIGVSGGFAPELLGKLAATLGVFVGAALVLGLLVLPRLTDLLGRMPVPEIQVVAAVGAGFGLALLAGELGFSPGLGAFIAGALMAESAAVHSVAEKILPLRDLFTGVFFVTVGSQLTVGAIAATWPLILAVFAAVVVGKLVGVGVGTFVAGRPPGEALRVGLGLAQIGEFSFIIAALGVSLGAVRPELYAVAVAVCALTAFTTPWFVRAGPPLANALRRRAPTGLRAYVSSYGSWVRRAGTADRRSPEWKVVQDAAVRATLYGAAVVGIFAGGSAVADEIQAASGAEFPLAARYGVSVGWAVVFVALVPFAVLVARHLRRLVRALARLAVPERLRGEQETTTERLVRGTFGTVVVAAVGGLALLVAVPVAGSAWVAVAVVGSVGLSAAVLGRRLGTFHAAVESTLSRLATDETGREEAIATIERSQAWGCGHREVVVPAAGGAAGRTLAELRLPELTGATVARIRRGRIDLRADGPRRFQAADRVVLLGDDAALARAEEIVLGIDLGAPGGAVEVHLPAAAMPEAVRGLEIATGVRVLAVKRRAAHLAPADAGQLRGGDVLVVAGTEDEIRRLRDETGGT